METREARIRAAFAAQAGWCERLGSPFTSALCRILGDRIDRSTAIGRRILDWPGEPDALNDSVPLRIAGGLHALVRRGEVPGLASLYPPHPAPSDETLAAVLAETFAEKGAALDPWLDQPPQTNEVARSAVLTAGYATVADRSGLPLALLELGASAGLNLLCDRYRIELGLRAYGPSDSPVRLAPGWTGGDPPAAEPRILARRGVDLNPVDVTRAEDRDRMTAYVWPDQEARLARLEAALAIAAREPPALDRGDAAAWLDQQLAGPGPTGVARVVAHSIAFQYFPAETQARIAARLEEAGAAATLDAPLGWLRYEAEPGSSGASLRLRLWPDGRDDLLAIADPHARAVEWRG